MPNEVDLLVFDLDGTLIDSRNDIIKAVNLTMVAFGLKPLAANIIEKYIGTGVQPLIRSTLEENKISRVEEAFTIFKDYYFKHACEETILYPGVLKALRHYEKLPKVILTNKSNEFIEPILRTLKIAPYFHSWYGRNSFPTTKPDPGPLLAISEKFRLPRERMVMIGDTDIDMRAGKQAGTLTCGAFYGYGSKETLTNLNPDYTVAKASDLIGLFNRRLR